MGSGGHGWREEREATCKSCRAPTPTPLPLPPRRRERLRDVRRERISDTDERPDFMERLLTVLRRIR